MNLSCQIFLGMAASVACGLAAGPDGLPLIKAWVAPLGTIFINLIKMMIIPVVFTSLVVGVSSLGDTRRLGRIGTRTLALYLGTTAVALLLGLLMAAVAQPGVGMSLAADAAVKARQAPSLMQVFVAMVPTSPIDAMAKGALLPTIVFSLFLGYGIVGVGGERARRLVGLFDAAAEVCYRVIAAVMTFSPVGVFALLMPVVAANGPKVLLPLISVIACVAAGSALHLLAVYSALVRFGAGMPPRRFFRGMAEAMLLAFTTCSSAGALPVNMKNLQEKLGCSREVASFVLPLGATVNMDGTALYMGVVSLFIANVYGVELSLAQTAMIVVTGTLASIGSAGVPGAALVMLVMVLQAAGLPLEGIALAAGIDRVLDMFRTCLNVTGDAAVALVVDRMERG